MENFYLFKDNKALAGRINSRIKGAAKERFEYWNIMYNCVHKCYDHNDVSWINKALGMAKAVGRYRASVAILREVVPFAFDKKAQIFYGKQQKGKVSALGGTYGIVLKQAVEDQLEAENAVPEKTATPWDYEKALANFLKTCGKHEVDYKKVARDIERAAKEESRKNGPVKIAA